MAWIKPPSNLVQSRDYLRNAGIDTSLIGWDPKSQQITIGGNPALKAARVIDNQAYATADDLEAAINAYRQAPANPYLAQLDTKLKETPTAGGTTPGSTGGNAVTTQPASAPQAGQGAVTADDLAAGLARLGLTQDQYQGMIGGAYSGDQGSINQLAQNKEVYGSLTGQPITSSVPQVTNVTPNTAITPNITMAGGGSAETGQGNTVGNMSQGDLVALIMNTLNETNPNPNTQGQMVSGEGSTSQGLINQAAGAISTDPVEYKSPDLNLNPMSYADALWAAKMRLDPEYQRNRENAGAVSQQQQDLVRQLLNARGQLGGGLAQEEAEGLAVKLLRTLNDLDVGYNTQAGEMALGLQNQDWDRALSAEQLAQQRWGMTQDANNANINNLLSLAGLSQQGDLGWAGLAQQGSNARMGNLLDFYGLQQQGNIANQQIGLEKERIGLDKERIGIDKLRLGQDNTQFYAGLQQDASQFAAQLGFNYNQLSQQDKWKMEDIALERQGLDLQTRGQLWDEIYQSTLLGQEDIKIGQEDRKIGQEDQRIKLAEANQDFQIWAMRQGIDIDWKRLSLDQKRLEIDTYLEERAQSLQARGLSIDAARVGETIRSNRASEGLRGQEIKLQETSPERLQYKGTRTQAYLDEVSNYTSREEALKDFNAYTAKMKQEGVDPAIIKAEIDRMFPVGIKQPASTNTRDSLGIPPVFSPY